MYVRYFASLWYKRIYLGLSLAQVRLMEKELTNLQPWRRKLQIYSRGEGTYKSTAVEKELTNLQPWRRKLQTVQSQTGALKQ